MAKNSDSQKDPSTNPLDLSLLKDLSFGPDWASDTGRKAAEASYRDHDGQERRGGRGGRRPEGGSRDGQSRDRRGPGGGAPRQGGSGAPRSDGPGQGGDRSASGGGRSDFRGERRERRGGDWAPPFEPTVEVIFVSQDKPFDVLLKAMRTTFKTYELFEIARIVLGKENRFVAIINQKPGSEEQRIYVSVPDQLPFETREEVINHVMANHLDKFFEAEDIEIDPPKGNFLMVSRCKITGELLAPPNFHRYQEILRDHYNRNITHMPYERFLERIESVKDPEVVQQWLDKMRKTRQYTLKQKEGDESPKVVLNALEDVKYFLLTEKKNDVFSLKDKIRLPGEKIESLPDGNIRRSIERELEIQRRFPLVTSNHLRGRLRRCNLNFFKKGSKGVTYLSAVKRKPRYLDTKFSDNIEALINFIEQHPGILVEDLLNQYLPAGVEAITEESQKSVAQDLRWLVGAGYVTEFGSGALHAEKTLSFNAADDPNRVAPAPAPSRKRGKKQRNKKEGAAAEAGEEGVEEELSDDTVDADEDATDLESDEDSEIVEEFETEEAQASEDEATGEPEVEVEVLPEELGSQAGPEAVEAAVEAASEPEPVATEPAVAAPEAAPEPIEAVEEVTVAEAPAPEAAPEELSEESEKPESK